MDKFSLIRGVHRNAWSVHTTGKIKKAKPKQYKKKLKRILKDEYVFPQYAAEHSVLSRDKRDDMVEVEIESLGSTSNRHQSKRKKKKRELPAECFRAYTLKKPVRVSFTVSDSKQDDNSASGSLESINIDNTNIKKAEYFGSPTLDKEAILVGTGGDVNVKSRKRKKVKSKGLKKEQDNVPLVVELSSSSVFSEVPTLLKNVESDTKDDTEISIKQFYHDLDEHSTYFTFSPVASVPAVNEEEEETSSPALQEAWGEERLCKNTVAGQWTETAASLESENLTNSSISVHQVPNQDKFVICMKHPFTIFFKGKIKIQVLVGCIEILGCRMDINTNTSETVYSPRGSSMLSIETCASEPPAAEDYAFLRAMLEELDLNASLSADIIENVEERNCVLVFETPVSSPLEKYLSTLIPEMQLFTLSRTDFRSSNIKKHNPLYTAEAVLKCIFELPDSIRDYKRYAKDDTEWGRAVDMIMEKNKNESKACAVVCGGKGVGKSTMIRYLVNQILPQSKEVLYLDFDPGQTEFTVPGCVSCTVIKNPLLGPNFTHNITPERMVYLGDVNVGQCPDKYLKSIRYIIDYCHSKIEFHKIPWIVNTMGFNKGVGVDLTVNLIRYVNPHVVVQINSMDPKLNFPMELDALNVWRYRSRLCHDDSNNFLTYTLVSADSMAESHGTGRDKTFVSNVWGLSPKRLREAMVLSYFSHLVKAPLYSLTEALPYNVSYNKLILCICHEIVPYPQMLSAMNGNLVALCSYEGTNVLIPDDPQLPRVMEEQAVCPCLGFGIVRGIDPEQKKLYLVTPLHGSLLVRVNCLMLGTVRLPTYVYTSSVAGVGQIPYTVVGPSHPTSQVKKRFFRPPIHQRNQQMQIL